MGSAAGALAARQRGAVLADCPHFRRDASRTSQKVGVDDWLARKLDVALVLTEEEVCNGYWRLDDDLRVHQDVGPPRSGSKYVLVARNPDLSQRVHDRVEHAANTYTKAATIDVNDIKDHELPAVKPIPPPVSVRQLMDAIIPSWTV